MQRLIQAQGLAGDDGGEDRIFLSANLTVVETHRGSDVTLNCRVIRNTDYGTVSSNNRRVRGVLLSFCDLLLQISWFKRSEDDTLLLVSVGDEIYIHDDRFSIIRPVLSMVGVSPSLSGYIISSCKIHTSDFESDSPSPSPDPI